ncbi:preprotein translocase subunit SecG [Bifidobacterium animalis subsp. animalis MCC 1489]|uniref:Protein-export membrane protein SecG n=1 Tax=Bifidobacterium animalis subsp. animalis MCC 0483 TaxID=1365955 RepID=A0AB34T9I2_9BIFI|nr:preprotein translocase subunit SecG [Bifidobacterium animalis]KOA49960.1 preprotein translocase subunit SecG [Bifidobacterium animalis subsp. animalis MCC 0483]KOA54844.1 preprotein translocase subunit SecG [Bifidobacterium animalis subsp. animalis ATCC 27672]KOA60457.1 preprotein translocase subunit SecG [Bifidobacterium animalis subsp. animalis MCC 0499]KOA64922.1 preprotein translocase subunit SecG [Bifidobacterium animalis subsp. animalis MCC 1489]
MKFGGSPVTVVKLILQIVLVVLSLLLTLLILMHKGKGGGLSDMFGGGLTQNAGSSGVAEKNLNRWTVIIALIWVAIIIALGLFTKFGIA